jgi:glycosyltransferase involved in cell wall biosynthesis
MRVNRRVVLCFSQVVSSNIYESILQNYTKMDVELVCVFFGQDTKPFQIYSETLKVKTVMLNVNSQWGICVSTFKYVRLLLRTRPRVVITFGQTATLLGLIGALVSPRSKRVYFRQHTSSNKAGMFSKGNIYDSLSNFLSQKIIVSNTNTFSYLVNKEKVPASKIFVCEFGFDVDSFAHRDPLKICAMKNKYNMVNHGFVVGIVSRVTPIKGLEYTFQAFRNLLIYYPDTVMLLANAMDADEYTLAKLLENIPAENIRILEREVDMVSVYGCMDILVHVPINFEVESYGLVYVEAFLSKLPTIITISGIANQIAADEYNCLVVNYRDSSQIFRSLVRLIENNELRFELGQNAFNSVSSLTTDRMNYQFRQFLEQVLESSMNTRQ